MEEKDAENENNGETNEEQTDLVNIEDESLMNASEEIVLTEPAEKHGCLKGCLLPVAVAVLVIAVLAMLAYSKRDMVRQWLLIRIVSNTHDLVLSNLPEELDKKSIESAFDKTKLAIKKGIIDEQEVKRAIEEYISNTKDKTSEERRKTEISKLMKALDESIYAPE